MGAGGFINLTLGPCRGSRLPPRMDGSCISVFFKAAEVAFRANISCSGRWFRVLQSLGKSVRENLTSN